MRKPDGVAVRGSRKWVQVAVNRHPDVLRKAFASFLAPGEVVRWLSPLETDNFAEYSDADLVRRLRLQLGQTPLGLFWPRRGPNWDALARTDSGEIILVEAKSYIGEVNTRPCRAGETSLKRIRSCLDETRRYLNVQSNVDWTSKYYQYANRLAHLYLLRALNSLPAHLVFLYFVNDHEMQGPRSNDEWLTCLTGVKATLGLEANTLSPYIHDVFIDVQLLEN